MKRSFESILDDCVTENEPINKVVLVERDAEPGGVALVNSSRTAKKSHIELMELEENVHNAQTFVQANALNKLNIIGKQMKSLHVLMNDVINETRLHQELNNAACNFVKKPGHVYHLYERPSGQKYFGMLSPEEWVNAPHAFMGSFRLEVDMSWTPAGQETTRFDGIKYLSLFPNSVGMKALT